MKTLKVKGTICSNDDKELYDWCGIEATCPKDVEKELEEANGEDVTIIINSGGGDVFAGNDMAYAVSQYKGNTTADITGLCASAATIVSSSANKVRCNPSMLFMIHNVSSGAYGDHRDMEHQAEVLKTANKAISNLYQQRTGLTEEQLLKLMDDETWMDAKKAQALGFVDEIIGEPSTLYNGFANILSDEAKKSIKESIKKQNSANGNVDSAFLMDREKEKLRLLRMKGEF